ncbi:MAG TPA: glycogen synthase [Planctomycetaceae bacterium]|nr:glycogen synthase [Planctomycetaceae bacterium]
MNRSDIQISTMVDRNATAHDGKPDGTGLRVLHVVPSLEIGGLEHVVLDLVRLGAELGQESHVLCIDRLGDLAPAVDAAGGHVHCLKRPPGFRFAELKGLREILHIIRPDVMHTHYPGGLYYAGPPARRLGLEAVIHTEHGPSYDDGWRSRLVGRMGARHAKTFVCVSHDTARHVLRHRIVAKRKIQVIYNGIDVEHFRQACGERDSVRAELGISNAACVVGTVGRLSEVKRQDVLIRAFAHVRHTMPESRLLLVGDGPARAELGRLVESLGLVDHVIFAGYRADRERCLAAMDVFALTSDSEGTPLSLLEAWAAGLPVAVTEVGGLPELVKDGVTGMIVPPREPETLATALLCVLSDGGLRRRLSEAGGREARSRFDRRVMAEQYAREYASLLAR